MDGPKPARRRSKGRCENSVRVSFGKISAKPKGLPCKL
uniref:Uncharacterized protein n=1 Tax=uncultured bacterium contig00118 TaxID=1181579 RepID=A0A806JY85_9BACT|nr:hypothetical protein [uncultured bacterium contig00118]